MNYKLIISYDGSNYSGWQIQPKERTVQGELIIALQNIFPNQNINLIGSGRTDSGVHANNQVANFKVETKISLLQIKRAINSNINKDINIKSCVLVKDDFNSRYSAIKRNYIYNVSTTYNVFNRNYEWHFKFSIDKKILSKCSDIVLGQDNFKNFCKASSLKESSECKIYYSEWTYKKNKLTYNVIADRFLHHMVRFLVGTMLEVSKGRFTINQFKSLFNKKKSEISVVKAPAQGLFLNDIEF